MSTYLICRCGRAMQVAPTFADEDYRHLKTHIGESVAITDERIEASAEGFSVGQGIRSYPDRITNPKTIAEADVILREDL